MLRLIFPGRWKTNALQRVDGYESTGRVERRRANEAVDVRCLDCVNLDGWSKATRRPVDGAGQHASVREAADCRVGREEGVMGRLEAKGV